MANTYIQAAFAVTMSAADAALLGKAEEAIDVLDLHDGDSDDPALTAAFAALGDGFAAVFPPQDGDPFASFIALFDDPDFAYLNAEISFGEADDDGNVTAFISGAQINVDNIAQLLFHCAKSALPCGFQYAWTCDKLRIDEFGGGAVAITEAGVEYFSTSEILAKALARASGEGADGFVLATRDPEHGLSFWNTDDGFGRLATATVFSETEAGSFDNPVAEDEPEWLALPASTLP